MSGAAIAGFSRLTLLDYPGVVAAEVFTQGCDMRCPFCHNASLIPTGSGAVSESSVLAYLKKRRSMLDGVVITGGEPTIQDLSGFLKKIKAMDYKIKLDTNGLKPNVLRDWITNGLIDYVAMDIKSSPSGYPAACGLPSPDMDKIQESIAAIRDSGLDYEFRTTVTPSLHLPNDIETLCRNLIPGAAAYWLQPFQKNGVPGTVFELPSDRFMDECLAAALPHVPSAKIRGR